MIAPDAPDDAWLATPASHGARRGKEIECGREGDTLVIMEVRLHLDEKDVEAARNYSGISDPVQLVQHVLRSYVHLRAAQELRGLGASDPQADVPPRRRPPDFTNDHGQPGQS